MYRPMVELLHDLGVDVDAILAEHSLSRQQLYAAETRLSPDQGRALGRSVLSRLPAGFDRCEFGLRAAERFVARDADLLGYIIHHAENPLAAARAFAEHGRLIGDSADFKVNEAGELVTIVFSLAGGKTMLHETSDFAVAIGDRLLRERSRGVAVPREVHVPRAKPRDPSVFRKFFGVPVKFNASAGALVYERARMLHPFEQSDERLAEILKQHAAERVRAFPRDDWHDRVRVIIVEGLAADDLAIERVAQRCGVAERTLRRRLAEAGTSYRGLVDDIRRERALLLLDDALSITDVAQQLGFSDATAFTRAFRRWTGLSPDEHRRRQRTPVP
jgi:AraC-like DNA-binding protein